VKIAALFLASQCCDKGSSHECGKYGRKAATGRKGGERDSGIELNVEYFLSLNKSKNIRRFV